MMTKILIALIDIISTSRQVHLALMLGWQDIKQRYRRSKLGPFWLTISMGVMIAMIGLIFGQALSAPLQKYLPFVATGIIFWTFVSTSINESCSAFINSAGMIRQLALPMSLYTVRIIWRNIVILIHNIILLPIVFLIAGNAPSLDILFLIPGITILLINIFGISIVLGICCTRFRDLPPIIMSLTQVFFYITPIIWMPDSLSPRSSALIVDVNPVYHLLELVRAPLLGQVPSLNSWTIGFICGILGTIFALIFLGMYKKRIAYWI